ncbi:hypothetical protein ANN_20059 [Periplaneta americana]|uniref:Uncharacterized protein n=1 Tax=Periplaneta americana TaxID=6978 RepID=A0ABQ8SC88_PERAM|nr:hypothetical protein ANN_20059 [Periplaneta americana]
MKLQETVEICETKFSDGRFKRALRVVAMELSTVFTTFGVNSFTSLCDDSALEHPPYSPDLSPYDFDLIPQLKKPLNGKRFANREDIITAFRREVLHTADCIQHLHHR